MTTRDPHNSTSKARVTWLLPLLVGLVGLLVLVPGIWSFGLWEPPGTWQVVIVRKTSGEGSLQVRRKAGRYDWARSEVRLAQEARDALLSAPKGARGERAPKGVDGAGGRAGRRVPEGAPGKAGASKQLPRRPP